MNNFNFDQEIEKLKNGTTATATITGKEPGKIWHGYQRAKAVIANANQLKGKIFSTAQNGGLSVGSIAILTQKSVLTAMATLPTVIAYTGLGGAAIFGFQAFKEIKKNGLEDLSGPGMRNTIAAVSFGVAGLLGPAIAAWLPLVMVGTAGYFGWSAYKDAKDTLNDRIVTDAVTYKKMERAEKIEAKRQKKLENAQKPSLFKRLIAKLSFKKKSDENTNTNANDNVAQTAENVKNNATNNATANTFDAQPSSNDFNTSSTPVKKPTEAEREADRIAQQEAEERREKRRQAREAREAAKRNRHR